MSPRRSAYVTVEITSTPIRCTPAQLDDFSSAIFDRTDLAGQVVGVHGPALDLITCVDTTTVASGVVVAVNAFEVALAQANIAGVRVDEVLAYHGIVREPRDRKTST